MDDLKNKVMDELEAFLENRLAGRLKPKAAEIDITAMKPGHQPSGGADSEAMEGSEGSAREEATENPAEEKQEDQDESKLTPEERQELERLYAKMCG